MSCRPTALVTGGATRLGAAIVEKLANNGWDLVIHCNNSQMEADRLAREVRVNFGVTAKVVSRDLSVKGVGSLVEESASLIEKRINVLVNNASIYTADFLESFSEELFDAHMAVNVRAPISLTKAFAEQADAGDCVVNIVDQRVLKPTPRFISYSLSKDALYDATIKCAHALAGKRIRVNAVSPGLALANKDQDVEEYAERICRLPLGRSGEPTEIADAVMYLIAAKSVTGQMITVDGGMHF